MSVWASYDWWAMPLVLVLFVLAFWVLIWNAKMKMKKTERSLDVFFARDRRADLDYELFGKFHARRAREIDIARQTAEILERVELYSVRVPEITSSMEAMR